MNAIADVRGEQQDAGRARYGLTPELVMEQVESDENRLRVPRTRADVEVWPNCLAAALNRERNGVLFRSLSKTDGGLMLTERIAEAHTRNNDLFFGAKKP